ncbi:hypothetical protein D9611_014974 [Ephemerocybe angulata]|uniref:Pre-SET domain-containing protein n=1 Tax=Ephemerocybe angulata TaxID=980116 RepID=A0A8H5FIG5_9AGAR|nr:hypothetical protein D9611_014974 [Tulosesus angulatus]
MVHKILDSAKQPKVPTEDLTLIFGGRISSNGPFEPKKASEATFLSSLGHITFLNEIDKDEDTPPFYYSDEAYRALVVPGPDTEILEGCKCRGSCHPDHNDCSCNVAYTKDGRLLDGLDEQPIRECNLNCSCSMHCRNRVVQQGIKHNFSITKTIGKGYGVYCYEESIPKGTFVGVYAGEVMRWNDAADRIGAKDALTNPKGRYVFAINFPHLQTDGWVPEYVVDAYQVGNVIHKIFVALVGGCVTLKGGQQATKGRGSWIRTLGIENDLVPAHTAVGSSGSHVYASTHLCLIARLEFQQAGVLPTTLHFPALTHLALGDYAFYHPRKEYGVLMAAFAVGGLMPKLEALELLHYAGDPRPLLERFGKQLKFLSYPTHPDDEGFLSHPTPYGDEEEVDVPLDLLS